MGDPRLSRIDETLRSLFEGLIPPQYDDEDDTEGGLRVEQAIENAKDIVHSGTGHLPSDINQAQDLIKRKLLRENASPEKAARFSNLYSRLLSIPVLNQKWSILYLLYKLSDDTLTEQSKREYIIETPPPPSLSKHERSRREVSAGYAQAEVDGEEQELQHSRDKRLRGSVAAASPRNGQVDTSSSLEKIQEPQGDNARKELQKLEYPTELELLRDLPFNLQGLSSANLEFTSPASLKLPSTLPIPILSLLHTLSEPCLLYRSLAEFVLEKDGGLINQSLRAAISDELRSYLTLIATLEGEIRRALTANEKGETPQNIRLAGVTLKRCVVWTRDATLGLRLMSLIVQASKEKRGGQIISFVHGLCTSHGDLFVGAFAERLVGIVARPFYEMLRRWIYDGELVDPYHEFFVTEPSPGSRSDVDPRRFATSIWEDKYKLDPTMVPTTVSAEFAKKVFLIGKSLNFIRHNCGDSDWVVEYSRSNSKPLDYANTASLSSTIDTAFATTMTRLTHLMSSKFGLFTHLTAIKKYLLLSQGDFIELLMESLAPNLDRPANSQYRHTLTSQLEHAIRHSNAQYDDPEVLRRLDARMLELSSGEIGWDCFTLEYKISAPCDVVITQWANTQYLKVFNLLWRIKRVEFSLNTTWRRCMTGSRGVLASVDDKLGNDWKRARCVVAEMVHFVNQLQYYILFEVVESSWETLQEAINKPNAALDDLIEAHTKYINSITHKGLLGQQRHHVTGQREDSFLAQLHYILKCMLSYRDVVDGLYSYSVAEFTKRQQFQARIEQRTAQGKWGITERDLASGSRSSTPTTTAETGKTEAFANLLPAETDSPALPPLADLGTGDEQSLLTSLRSRLLQLSAEFRSRVNVLLYDLAHQPDTDLRFLGVVMNFNEVYKPINVRRQQARKEREKRELQRQVQEGGNATEGNASSGRIGDESGSKG